MKPKYEKNDISYQDEAWFEREKRNIFDIRNQHRELMSQKYYSISDNDPDTYFEVTFRPNMLANPPRLVKRHSQPIKGRPPEGMKPAPTGMPYLKL